MDQLATTCAKHSGRQFSLAALAILLTLVSIALAIYVRYYLLGVVGAALVTGLLLVAFGVTLRHTRLLGAGALLAGACLLMLLIGGWGAVWVGQSLVSLTFIVVDAETDAPVNGATVRLRDLPFASGLPPPEIAPGEAGVETRTSLQGHSTITYKFVTHGTSGGFLARDTATAQLWETFFLQVTADGYESVIVPLPEVAGHYHDLAWPQQPRPIEIRLKHEEFPYKHAAQASE